MLTKKGQVICNVRRKYNMSENTKPNVVQAIVGVIVAIGLLWYLFGGGLERQAASDLNRIEQQVAADSVRQYEIAKRSGNAMDAYVHASLVAAAYLQAEDEANYKKWKEIENQEARNAGMPTN
ncbi:MAG: hypothetical protein GY834_03075 [Bacteroidetes bacterium]|nr:hypothetical protein [Bacteroidota bacterium]